MYLNLEEIAKELKVIPLELIHIMYLNCLNAVNLPRCGFLELIHIMYLNRVIKFNDLTEELT